MFALWIIQLIIAGLLCVAAGYFLRERGINAFSKIRDLLRQPILVLLFLSMFVCSLVQYASNKLPPLSAPPLFNLPTLNSEPTIIDSQLALSNLQFTAIYPLSNSVLLEIGWAATNPPPEEMLDIYSTSNLVSGAWEAIGSAAAPSNAPGVEVPHSALVGGESLDYYINVRHALDVALNFSVAANGLSGSKVMLAHSLGNMLVSEAARYHLLEYSKYYMLNAAVPMEAYDDDANAQEMSEHGWNDVDPSKWAANWSEHILYSDDPRQTLKWRGRFVGIHDAINCYSPTENILANATMNGWGGLWGAQELFKGTATLHLIPGKCEGGWGYNSEHTNLAGLLTDFAKTNIFTDTELTANPIFRRFDNALLHQTNLISIAQTELNKVLGDGIPATSFAAGRNPIGNNCVLRNVQLIPEEMTCWPMERMEDDQCKWLHSDIRDIAFFYVNHIFRMVTT